MNIFFCTTVNLSPSSFRENLLMNTKNEWEKHFEVNIANCERSMRLQFNVWGQNMLQNHFTPTVLSFFSISCEGFGKISKTFPSKLKLHLNQFLLSGGIIVCFAPVLHKMPFHSFISICYVVGLNATAKKITWCHVGFGEWIGIHHWSV